MKSVEAIEKMERSHLLTVQCRQLMEELIYNEAEAYDLACKLVKKSKNGVRVGNKRYFISADGALDSITVGR